MPRSLSSEEVADYRARLVEAATRCFGERGRAGVTLRAVAEEAGCSRMTPYRYFESKDELLAAVRAAAFRRLAGAAEAAARRARGPRARLEAGGRAYLRFAAREPEAYRLMFEVSQGEEESHPELVEQLAQHRRRMKVWAGEAIEAGLIEGDPQTVAQLFWAGMHGVIMLEIAGRLTLGRSFERLSKEMVRTLFRGMRPAVEARAAIAPGEST